MEFNEKLQELRRQRGLTQEELAEALYVSRTAVSKWESGRGYPNIDSLKAIAKFFSVSIDELLSGDELLTVAEADTRKNEGRLRNIVFGLLDCSALLFLFLPLFGQEAEGIIRSVSLLSLTDVGLYLKISYITAVAAGAVWGILILALQGCEGQSWSGVKYKISLALSGVAVLLFIISSQPYAALLAFIFLAIKVLMLIKWK